MKNNILHIVFTLVLLVSCNSERSEKDEDMAGGTRGMMSIEVLVDGADEHDYVHTARFITFDDASVFPVIDINEVVAFDTKEQDAKKFGTTLEVSSNPDKMLVVVVNEPGTMTAALEAVTFPSELEDLIFQMGDAFNFNHTLPASSGLPMTGVKRKITVTEGNTTREKINLERGVARVELWLKKEDAVAFARLTNSFRVLLEKTYTGGYLVAGTEADGTRFQTGADVENNFGRMLIPASDYEYVGWFYGASNPLELDDTKQLICAFYVPERTCSAPGDVDKLVLDIIGLSTPDGLRDSRTILSEFSPEGGGNMQALTEIRRNNVYRIVGIVKEKTVQFEHTVMPWSDAGQGIIIDPQYFLRVSRDNLYISNDGKSVIITTETNYDRTDRGFPKGIQLGTVSYYDKNGNLLAPSHVQSDWLQVAMSEVAGSLLQKLTFTVSGNLSSVDIGCYAVVEVKAGNLTKEVRVTRS